MNLDFITNLFKILNDKLIFEYDLIFTDLRTWAIKYFSVDFIF